MPEIFQTLIAWKEMTQDFHWTTESSSLLVPDLFQEEAILEAPEKSSYIYRNSALFTSSVKPIFFSIVIESFYASF